MPAGIKVSVTGSIAGTPSSSAPDIDSRSVVYRAKDSRYTPGSGLGLALVAGVAGLHEMAVDIAHAFSGCRIASVTVRRRD
jgi:D-arabinose 1-dehydrogenase-like Zn-dependent alcohol dehydrogenase